ncbi:hypothetical protein BD413DRAFT_616770 [Trametes elegans]|nr:hypothetical protein BD413DRAFT_616770 [Trametes elegans]
MAPFGGLHVLSDTGPPDGQDVYTTLVFIHGYVWHGGAFGKLLPLAPHFGCRIIVLNRRDYPGASPYTAEERALLPPVPDRPRTNPDEIRSSREMLAQREALEHLPEIPTSYVNVSPIPDGF